jgi:PAS domain-containing protein
MLFAGAALGDGTIVKYVVDIEDRKRAEAALRDSEERLRVALAAGAMGTWTYRIPQAAESCGGPSLPDVDSSTRRGLGKPVSLSFGVRRRGVRKQ